MAIGGKCNGTGRGDGVLRGDWRMLRFFRPCSWRFVLDQGVEGAMVESGEVECKPRVGGTEFSVLGGTAGKGE